MKIIELVGPSGVGKTTLKTALIARRADLPFPLLDQAAIPLAAIEPRFLADALQALAHGRVKPARRFAQGIAGVMARRFRGAALGVDWDSEWSDFLTRCSRLLVAPDRPGNLKASRLAFLVNCLAEAHFARLDSSRDGFAILDEGPLQRGISVGQMLGSDASQTIRDVFDACPMPDCAIVLQAGDRDVRARIEGRPGSKPIHLEETRAAIAATDICAAALTRRGVPVLNLKCAAGEQVDMDALIGFLARLA